MNIGPLLIEACSRGHASLVITAALSLSRLSPEIFNENYLSDLYPEFFYESAQFGHWELLTALKNMPFASSNRVYLEYEIRGYLAGSHLDRLSSHVETVRELGLPAILAPAGRGANLSTWQWLCTVFGEDKFRRDFKFKEVTASTPHIDVLIWAWQVPTALSTFNSLPHFLIGRGRLESFKYLVALGYVPTSDNLKHSLNIASISCSIYLITNWPNLWSNDFERCLNSQSVNILIQRGFPLSILLAHDGLFCSPHLITHLRLNTMKILFHHGWKVFAQHATEIIRTCSTWTPDLEGRVELLRTKGGYSLSEEDCVCLFKSPLRDSYISHILSDLTMPFSSNIVNHLQQNRPLLLKPLLDIRTDSVKLVRSLTVSLLLSFCLPPLYIVFKRHLLNNVSLFSHHCVLHFSLPCSGTRLALDNLA